MSEIASEPNMELYRAAALDAILAEHGQEVRRHVTETELSEMIEERATQLALRNHRQAA